MIVTTDTGAECGITEITNSYDTAEKVNLYENDEQSQETDDIDQEGSLEQKKVYNFDGVYEAKCHKKVKRQNKTSRNSNEHESETTTTTTSIHCALPEEPTTLTLPKVNTRRCGCSQ